jgi:hypothetical protein
MSAGPDRTTLLISTRLYPDGLPRVRCERSMRDGSTYPDSSATNHHGAPELLHTLRGVQDRWPAESGSTPLPSGTDSADSCGRARRPSLPVGAIDGVELSQRNALTKQVTIKTNIGCSTVRADTIQVTTGRAH